MGEVTQRRFAVFDLCCRQQPVHRQIPVHAELLEVRRHAGLMVPAPVQAAMVAALGDDAHADEQRARYAARRARLRAALEQAGWAIGHSEAGLYLWAARPGLDGWDSVGALAGAGILVAPGEFYGPAGRGHIRVALTATDERIDAPARPVIP